MGLLKLRAGHPKFPWWNPTAIAGNHSLGESNPYCLPPVKNTTWVMCFAWERWSHPQLEKNEIFESG